MGRTQRPHTHAVNARPCWTTPRAPCALLQNDDAGARSRDGNRGAASATGTPAMDASFRAFNEVLSACIAPGRRRRHSLHGYTAPTDTDPRLAGQLDARLAQWMQLAPLQAPAARAAGAAGGLEGGAAPARQATDLAALDGGRAKPTPPLTRRRTRALSKSAPGRAAAGSRPSPRPCRAWA